MTYVARCCGVHVLGRLVWLALGVTDPEDVCPRCGRWTRFDHENARPVFGKKAA